MYYTIREMRTDECPLLDDFLYQAIYQPDKTSLAPKSIINKPELQVYIKDFGKQMDDYCFCAEVDNRVVGAVWVRNINGYGSIHEDTVEFAISVFDEYQKMGIGTALMKKMLEHLQKLNYSKASLDVQKGNYAVRMYQKIGFGIACENEQEHIMWSNQHDDVQNQVCTTVEGVWYGIWDSGVYSIAKKASELDDPNLENITIPNGKYAIFSTDFGGFAGDVLPKLREQIFDCWLPDSGYMQTDDYEVEVYHLYPKYEKHKRHYEIWVPVVRK